MINDNIIARKKDLLEEIEYTLKGYTYSIKESGSDIRIQFAKDSLIGVSVKENGYCIYNISAEWAEKTTYLINKEEDGTRYYYLDSIDECIGEIERIATLEIAKMTKPIVDDGTLLSVFQSIEDQYSELKFSKINAKGEEKDKAVYIYPKNASGKGKVIFEIWKLKTESEYDLYMKREYMTDDEYSESQQKRPNRTTGKRGVIKRVFITNQELIDFMTSRLDKTRE